MGQRQALHSTYSCVFMELRLLDALVKDNSTTPRERTISVYLTKLAQLGGYLARANDPPPGDMVMWRGMSRLIDLELGAFLGAQLVGNCTAPLISPDSCPDGWDEVAEYALSWAERNINGRRLASLSPCSEFR